MYKDDIISLAFLIVFWLLGFGCGVMASHRQNDDYICTSEQIINHEVVCMQYTRKEEMK